jgi:hypothetical protein
MNIILGLQRESHPGIWTGKEEAHTQEYCILDQYISYAAHTCVLGLVKGVYSYTAVIYRWMREREWYAMVQNTTKNYGTDSLAALISCSISTATTRCVLRKWSIHLTQIVLMNDAASNYSKRVTMTTANSSKRFYSHHMRESLPS